MTTLQFLFCLLVIGSTRARAGDDCDLNLESIFRTPKDFSNVNFDHFEILERNNFENQHPTPITTNDVAPDTKDYPLKSIANAQVMLRIGGDNIHDCNRVAVPSYRSILDDGNCNLGAVRPSFEYPSQMPVPALLPFHAHIYPSYPQYLSAPVSPQRLYPYPPPPPFAFPGCYYKPRSFPSYSVAPYALYSGQLVPDENQLESTRRYFPSEISCEESDDLLDNRRDEIVTAENILDSRELLDDKIVETNFLNIHSIPRIPLTDKSYLVSQKPEIVQETVIKNSPSEAPLVAVVTPPEVISASPNPCPKKISYVEVCVAPTPKPDESVLPKKSIETLLDQALIPFTCQKCAEKHRLLVTYPVINNEDTFINIPQEDIEVSGCSCCQNYGVCSCCNNQRNACIPYGERFSKDVDSLFDIITPVKHIPSNLYKASFEDAPVKLWSPLSLLMPKTLPNIITTPSTPSVTSFSTRSSDSPCSSFSPSTSWTPSISYSPSTYSPSSSCSPSFTTKVVQLKSERPRPGPILIKNVVHVTPANPEPCSNLATTHSSPCAASDVMSIAPLKYSSGYGGNYESGFSSGISQYGLEKPQLYLDGYQTTSGSGYYSNPDKTVVYNQPTLSDFVKIPNPITPVIERSEYVEPHLFNNVHKYDIITEGDISPLIAPDLIPANKYVHTDCNKVIPSGTTYHREFVLPLGMDTPLLGHGLVQDLPSPGDLRCSSCSKYRGEMNELESDN